MTWRGERRKQLPPDWAARRRARLELDGHRCTAMVGLEHIAWFVVDETTARSLRCAAQATDVHHAFGASDHRIELLRSLCAYHHRLVTQAEAAQAQGRGPTRLRPTKPHPGLR